MNFIQKYLFALMTVSISLSYTYASSYYPLTTSEMEEEVEFIEKSALESSDIFTEYNDENSQNNLYIGKITNKRTDESILIKCTSGSSKEDCTEIGFFEDGPTGTGGTHPFKTFNLSQANSLLKQALFEAKEKNKLKYFPVLKWINSTEMGPVIYILGGCPALILTATFLNLPFAVGFYVLTPAAIDVMSAPVVAINRLVNSGAYHKSFKAILKAMKTGMNIKVTNRQFKLIREMK